MHKLSPLLGLALVLLVSGFSVVKLTEPSTADISEFLDQQIAWNHLPGMAVVITRGSDVIFLKGYGTNSDGHAITPQTQFYLASVSKSFTALAVMQLIETGALDLDMPVEHYLPEFTTQDSQVTHSVTVRQLLNQTSGLSDQGFPEMSLPQMTSPRERLQSLHAARPVAPPGREFHYFNPNYEILARLVEVGSGQSFSSYLHDHLFAPLEMTNTSSVINTSEVQNQAQHLAQGHILPYAISMPVEEMRAYVGGSGGVISTADDLANYLIMQNEHGRFRDQILISPDSMKLMQTPPPNVGSNYGMGWFVRQKDGQPILEHNGILSAFYAEVALLPKEQIGIALLYNSSSFPATAFVFPRIQEGLVALLTNHDPQMGGFTLIHWGILLGGITLLGIGLALCSWFRLPRWKQWASSVPRWRLIPGILWTFAPALFLIELPSIVAAGSDRAFGYAALFRALPELFVWLVPCMLLGVLNGIRRLQWALSSEYRETSDSTLRN